MVSFADVVTSFGFTVTCRVSTPKQASPVMLILCLIVGQKVDSFTTTFAELEATPVDVVGADDMTSRPMLN